MIEGDRLKKDVIRADRADGFFLRNVWVEQGAFNDVDVVETNGFQPAPARHALRPELRRAHLRLRQRPLRAHRGVRQRRLRHLPGLGPRGPLPALRDRDPPRQLAPQRARLLGHGGQRHLDAQLEVPPQQRRHLRRLVRLRPPRHAAGLLEVGHQRRSTRTTRTTSRTTATPTARTRRSRSAARRSCARSSRCRSAPASSSTASTSNLISNNTIYDNWRSGVRLFWVPAAVRGENDPAKQFDTSNGNKFIGNQLGYDDGKRQPNGVDFFWDEQGIGNCWPGNQAPGGKVTSDPATLPQCPAGLALPAVGNPAKIAAEAPCADVGSGDQPGPARLHLVHDPAQADRNEVGGWRRPSCSSPGWAALLLLGDRDGGADPGGDRHRAAAVEGEAEPDPRPELPRDRILTGQLRNASLRAVDLETERVRILDAKGRRLQATALFSQHFSHGLYPWSMHVEGLEVRAPPDRQDRHDQAGPGGAADALVARAGGRLGAGRGALRRRHADAASLRRAAGLDCRACPRTPSTPARTSRSAARPSRSSGSTRCSPSSTSRGCPSR